MTNKTARLHDIIRSRLDDVLVDAHFPELPNFGRGKVRDHYDLNGGRRLMITTDRQSAFDQVLAAVPFKGQVLTSVARYWFEATRDIIPNHVIEYPDPNVIVARHLTMLPVEVVVRDYLTGSTSTSIWPKYQKGERTLYGHTLPDGLRKNEKLPQTILTPTTKGGAGEHDEPITGQEIVGRGLVPAKQWQEVEEKALALFARGREMASKQGLILVDTKYEFGFDETGRLTVADEIHTPDSSRYWRMNSYAERLGAGEEPESLDKEFLRLWIAARCDPYSEPIPPIPPETMIDFSARYIALYETVSGETFDPLPATPSVRDRVRANVQRYV